MSKERLECIQSHSVSKRQSQNSYLSRWAPELSVQPLHKTPNHTQALKNYKQASKDCQFGSTAFRIKSTCIGLSLCLPSRASLSSCSPEMHGHGKLGPAYGFLPMLLPETKLLFLGICTWVAPPSLSLNLTPSEKPSLTFPIQSQCSLAA